jgi:hypothetical protein
LKNEQKKEKAKGIGSDAPGDPFASNEVRVFARRLMGQGT